MNLTHSMICRLALGVCLACLILPAKAQPEQEAPVTEVSFMSWEQAQPGLFTTRDGHSFSPLQAPAYDFGKPSRIPENAPLKIYQSVLRDGKPTYEVVGEASLPTGCLTARAYLIRQPDRGDLRSYRIVAMSDDAAVFKAGDVRVFNFSQYAAMIKVSGSTLALGPLEWKTVPAMPDQKYRVRLITTLEVNERWTRLIRNLLSIGPNQRGSVLIVHTRAGIGEILGADQSRTMILATSEYIRGK